MVALASFVGTAAFFVGYASALPRPGWAASSDYASWEASSAAVMPSAASAASWDTMAASATMASSDMGSGSMGSSKMGSSNMGSKGKDSMSSADSMATAASSWGSSGYNSGSSWGYNSIASSDVMATATAAAMGNSWWSSSAAPPMYTETAMATETMMASSTWEATSTAAATSVSYGSGSSNWGGSGYESCVQQCMMEYAPPATITASPSSSYSGSSSGSSGSGTTHTVIVAPTQGVLRFVPFSVNASAGDTILYEWHANNHTVTKGSELEICNETSTAPFATGEHDLGFTFTETVNDTNPVFFFCSTPGHCEKGMFGIINPPSVENNAPTSVASMMPAMMANSSTLSAMYAASNVSNNSAAASWGNTMDMSSMPAWSQSLFAENVLYTRAFLAANPAVLKPDGSIDMSATNGTWNLPADISQTLSSSGTSASANASTAGVANAGAATSASSSTAPSGTAAGKTGAASATTVSGALLSVAAIAATFLAL
ncbi:hypothetical protein IEO21_01653 [Rhodonia placenta]|uniref:Phytocyanin domain-containing protein n=1 Tax=Rhodonia placenta TaxID=104341 RepID=A0A8H7U602_9APHY|nr:hypothetical protein IEO21_01653 [Postia placenta]